MFPLDLHIIPSVEDFSGWLWASYPLHLSQAIDNASAAYAELSLRVVELLEQARQEGLSVTFQDNLQRQARSRAKVQYRPLLDAVQTFLEVGTRRQRRQHLLAHRRQCTQWQQTRRAGDYPAAYSMSFLEGEFPPLVDTTIHTDKQRQQLYKDPLEIKMAVKDTQIPTVLDTDITDTSDLLRPREEKEWHDKSFIHEFQEGRS